MKYKAGDKIRIKTWEEMKKEYGLDSSEDIDAPPYHFGKNRESYIKQEFPDRIFEIKEIHKGKYTGEECYVMINSKWEWVDYMIEKLCEKPVPIQNRFEILDL